MLFRSLLDSLKPRPARAAARRDGAHRRSAAIRLHVESLEDRVVPSFSPAVNYPVATESPIVTADFNGDGRLDLAGANINSVSVLLGNGDGTFQPAITSPTTGAGGALAAADFNGDGKIDLVTTRDGTAMILLGKGDGTFQAPSPLPGSGGTDLAFLAVAVGDVNGDGKADLILTGNAAFGYPDASVQGFYKVLLGNDDGTFTQGGGDSVGADASSVALADLNGDGKLDLVIGDSSTQVVYVIPGHGDGTFYYQTGYGIGAPLYGVGVADFNHDGKPDLAIPFDSGGVSSLEIFSGNGDGTFAYGGNFPSGGLRNPTIADFNRDGNLDVATTSPGGVSVVLGNGDGTFAPPLGVATDNPWGLVAADYNGDGFPDLAVNAGSNTVSVLLNDATWPAPAPLASSLAVSGFPSPTTAGVAGSFTVTAKNADGSIDTGYTGTVHISSSDSQAALPADYTFTAADAGVHTFSATLKTAGTQSITAADASTFGLTGTDSGITVNGAVAGTMAVVGFPSSITAGVAGYITVTLKDIYGNVANGYTGTVHLTSSDPKAALPANYTFTAADAGKHTFSVTLKSAGTQSITAMDIAVASLTATESGITVNAAAASQFVISAPSSVAAGTPFSLTITVEDAYGNVVTGYVGTIHFSSTDRRATLPANYSFTAADKGVHTFTGLILRTKGKQTITVTDTLNSSLTASVFENVL
jgi:hypothetical protein